MKQVGYRKFFDESLTKRRFNNVDEVTDTLFEFYLLLQYRWSQSKESNDDYWFALNKLEELLDGKTTWEGADANSVRHLVSDFRAAIFVNYPRRQDRMSIGIIRDTLKLLNVLEANLFIILTKKTE